MILIYFNNLMVYNVEWMQDKTFKRKVFDWLERSSQEYRNGLVGREEMRPFRKKLNWYVQN